MSEYKPLKDVQAGDEVIEVNWNWCHSYKLVRVKKVTATQVVLINENRYRKEDGSFVGRARLKIVAINAESLADMKAAEDENKRDTMARSLSEFHVWKYIPLATLEQIQQLLDKVNAERDEANKLVG